MYYIVENGPNHSRPFLYWTQVYPPQGLVDSAHWDARKDKAAHWTFKEIQARFNCNDELKKEKNGMWNHNEGIILIHLVLESEDLLYTPKKRKIRCIT